jgi:uncharacterized protein (TIGR02231 family)
MNFSQCAVYLIPNKHIKAMKKLGIFILGVALCTNSYSAERELEVDSKIDGVTVYLSGAQVSRKGYVKLKKGINKLRFNNVSPYVNANTIQVKGAGYYTILDVKKDIEYPKQEVVDNTIPKSILLKIDKTQDSIFNLNYSIEDLNNKMTYLATEKNLLLKNNVFTNDSLPIVEQSLAYLRKQLFDINAENMSFKKKRDEIQLHINDINARLQELKNFKNNNRPVKTNAPIHYVEVTVQAEQEGNGNMAINYMVNNAGWSPMYDIRVEDITKPVELTMKANVYQNSGEEWNDVNLTLSTNDPFKSKIKPELSVWYLNYYNPNYGNRERVDDQVLSEISIASKAMADEMAEDSYKGRASAPMPTALSSVNYSVQKEMMANVEYKISLSYTVKSDNKAHMVAVSKQSIKSEFYHYLVPKYDNESYLVAKLVDWEELNLLPSKANIFYEGTYVGETRINPTANDTLNISLGNDRSLMVKRNKNKDKTKEKVFTNQKEQTVSYDLIVKNASLKELNVIIEDHIPVATNESIKVKVENKSGANYDEPKGMLTWDFKLKAKGTKEYSYTYTVKYDKTKNIDLSTL